MNCIMSILMPVVRCYFNIKCEISVSNRTELIEHLKNSTKFVLIGVLYVSMKLTVMKF